MLVVHDKSQGGGCDSPTFIAISSSVLIMINRDGGHPQLPRHHRAEINGAPSDTAQNNQKDDGRAALRCAKDSGGWASFLLEKHTPSP